MFDTQFEFDAELDGRVDDDPTCPHCEPNPCRCLYDESELPEMEA